MADTPSIAPDGAWNTLFQTYENLTQKLEHAQSQDRDALERKIAKVEDDLLETPAPHLTAVRLKLEMLFGEQLGLDPEAEARRLLVDDMSHLIQAHRELLGA